MPPDLPSKDNESDNSAGRIGTIMESGFYSTRMSITLVILIGFIAVEASACFLNQNIRCVVMPDNTYRLIIKEKAKLHGDKAIQANSIGVSNKKIIIDESRAHTYELLSIIYECSRPEVVAAILENLKEDDCAIILTFMSRTKAIETIEAFKQLDGVKNVQGENAKRAAEIVKMMQYVVIRGKSRTQ